MIPVHSRYDVSLKGGKNSGKDSFAPSPPTSHGHFDDVPEDVIALPPDTSLASPSHFSDFRHHLYDPLSLKVSEGGPESPLAYRRRGLLPGIAEDVVWGAAPAPAPSPPSPVSAPSLVPPPDSTPAQTSLALGLLSPAPALSATLTAPAPAPSPLLMRHWHWDCPRSQCWHC